MLQISQSQKKTGPRNSPSGRPVKVWGRKLSVFFPFPVGRRFAVACFFSGTNGPRKKAAQHNSLDFVASRATLIRDESTCGSSERIIMSPNYGLTSWLVRPTALGFMPVEAVALVVGCIHGAEP